MREHTPVASLSWLEWPEELRDHHFAFFTLEEALKAVGNTAYLPAAALLTKTDPVRTLYRRCDVWDMMGRTASTRLFLKVFSGMVMAAYDRETHYIDMTIPANLGDVGNVYYEDEPWRPRK